MGFATAAAAIGLAISGTGLGLSASGALNPSQPNLGAASAAQAIAQAEYLPILARLQASAALGKSTTAPLSPKQQKDKDKLTNMVSSLQQQIAAGGVSNAPSSHGSFTSTPVGTLKAQLAKAQAKLAALPSGKADFTGYSTADIQGKLMNQLAAGKLATEQKYDSQFIDQALKQEALANPEGVAARKNEFEDLQKQLNNPPKSPVSEELQRQVQGRVNAGNKLTPEEQAMLDRAVNDTSRIGGTSGTTPDFSNALTTGFEGEQRALGNAGSGTQFLASGLTPDDIAFRANQQNISNLSQFYSGQTPQSQFKTLTGAQTGATPIAQNAPLPSYNMGAGAQGAAAGVSQYQQELAQPNSWLSGLSGLAGLTNVGAAAFG